MDISKAIRETGQESPALIGCLLAQLIEPTLPALSRNAREIALFCARNLMPVMVCGRAVPAETGLLHFDELITALGVESDAIAPALDELRAARVLVVNRTFHQFQVRFHGGILARAGIMK